MSTTKAELLKAIRRNCMFCTYDQMKEIELCPSTKCSLWPFRMGKDPDKKPQSEAQRKARLAALQKAWKTNDEKYHRSYDEINVANL